MLWKVNCISEKEIGATQAAKYSYGNHPMRQSFNNIDDESNWFEIYWN